MIKTPPPSLIESLLDKYITFPNIRAHVTKVAEICQIVHSNLKDEIRVLIDADFLYACAILHDITKERSLTTKENHDKTGGELLTSLGYPEVGKVISQHGFVDNFDPNSVLRTEEIVCYCDKRVMHDKVVSLMERKLDLYVRYNSNNCFSEPLFREYFEIEEKLDRSLKVPLRSIIEDNSVPTTFSCSVPGNKICISCSFTMWDMQEMEKNSIVYPLPPGVYYFVYYVDGVRTVDPKVSSKKDENGDLLNVIEINV